MRLLDRLLLREKLTLLVLVPLVGFVLLAVPLLGRPISDARLSADVQRSVEAAQRTEDVVTRLQEARLQSVAFLSSARADPEPVALRFAAATAAMARLRSWSEDPEIQGRLVRVLDRLDVDALRTQVLARRVSSTTVVQQLGRGVDGLVAALELRSSQGVTTQQSQQVLGGQALLEGNESSSRAGALLLAAAAGRGAPPAAVSAWRRSSQQDAYEVARFAQSTPEGTRELLRTGLSGGVAEQLETLVADLEAGRLRPGPEQIAPTLAALRAQASLRQIVSAQILAFLTQDAATTTTTARWTSAALGGVVAGLAVLLMWLSILVSRSIARPLRRLTDAAGQVADLAQEQLLRVADDDRDQEAVPRLAAVSVGTRGEVGDLASAFNRVQATAVLLLERQATSRRNMDAMFSTVGERTATLVERQLALIDGLERTEDDPDRLDSLYRLDHLSTRLRRNARNLVVLSGTRHDGLLDGPVPLPDAVRVSLGSVEEYQRVRLTSLPAVDVVPDVAGDLVLLVAELLENATVFSSPSTSVEVTGELVGADVVLRIVDHGLGMSPEHLADENAKLRRRERLDLAPTEVLGLFVVGRLSRRHGIEVTLGQTPGRGVTAQVVVPGRLLAREGPDRPARPAPEAAEPVAVAAGTDVEPAATPVAVGPVPVGPVAVGAPVGPVPVGAPAVTGDVAAGQERRTFAQRLEQPGTPGTPAAAGTLQAPAGPVDDGPHDSGPIPTGPIPTGPIPTGPIPTGPAPVDLDAVQGVVVRARTAGVDQPPDDSRTNVRSRRDLRRRVPGDALAAVYGEGAATRPAPDGPTVRARGDGGPDDIGELVRLVESGIDRAGRQRPDEVPS